MNRYHFMAKYDSETNTILWAPLDRLGLRLIHMDEERHDLSAVQCEIEDSADTTFLFWSNLILDAGSLVRLADRVRDRKHETYCEYIEDWMMAKFEVRRIDFPVGTTVNEIVESEWDLVAPEFATSTVVNALNMLRQEDWGEIAAAVTAERDDTPVKVIDTGQDVYHIRETADCVIVHQILEV